MTDSQKANIIHRESCLFFKQNRLAVLESGWTRETVTPRQFSMYFMRKHTVLTFKEIGAFYNRDHSTVHAAQRTVRNLIEANGFAAKAKMLDDRISKLLNDLDICREKRLAHHYRNMFRKSRRNRKSYAEL